MDAKTLLSLKKLLQDCSSLINQNNRMAILEEHDLLVDSAYPAGSTRIEEGFGDRKIYLFLDKCKNLIIKTNTLMSDPAIQSSKKVMGELAEIHEKLHNEKAVYDRIYSDARKYISNFKKIKKNELKAQAESLIAKYSAKNQITRDRHPYKNSWEIIQRNLELLNAIYLQDSERYKHTLIFNYLNSSEDHFIESIRNNMKHRELEGELGYLVFARLCWIEKNGSLKNRGIATFQIDEFLDGFSNNDGLFQYKEPALMAEVKKLLIHQHMNPGHKNLWLGTGTDVTAWKKKYPRKGIYLNAANRDYSWTLNRAHMEIAGYLDFNLILIQRQFPNIENAIMTREPGNVLVELVRECRSDMMVGSIYHHEDKPTYTASEILALVEMGFITVKNRDGLISMRLNSDHTPRLRVSPRATLFFNKRKPCSIRLPRSHSADSTVSFERGDFSRHELLRVFEIPNTSGEKLLAKKVDIDRMQTLFVQEGNVDDEVNEPEVDLKDIFNRLEEVRGICRETIKSMNDSGNYIYQDTFKKIVSKIEGAYSGLKSKRNDPATIKVAEQVISEAEKAIAVKKSLAKRYRADAKYKETIKKANEAFTKINDYVRKLDLQVEDLAQASDRFVNLPELLAKQKSREKLNLEQAEEIIAIEESMSEAISTVLKRHQRLSAEH